MTPNINKGIKYFDDISERIPRSEIDDYLASIIRIADELKSKSNIDGSVDIVGSYRRGAETSGDIDVIITSNSGTFYNMFLDILIKEGIIVDMLSRGKTKSMCVSKLPGKKYRRLISCIAHLMSMHFQLCISQDQNNQYDSKIQSITNGYTLNEHGLYKSNCKEKVNCHFNTEQDIFEYLKMEYISQSSDRILAMSNTCKVYKCCDLICLLSNSITYIITEDAIVR